MKQYQNIQNAMEDLRRHGYLLQFIKKDKYFHCLDKNLNFCTYELTIEEAYRYEDKHEPGHNKILYSIESASYGLKGILVN